MLIKRRFATMLRVKKWLVVMVLSMITGQLYGDIKLRKIEIVSLGAFLNITEKVTWYMKDSRFCEKSDRDLLLGTSTSSKIFDLKKKRVYEVDYDDKTYNMYSLEDYKKSDITSLDDIFYEDEFEDYDIEYFFMDILPMGFTRNIGGYETKGILITFNIRLKNPFKNSHVDALGSLVLWGARLPKSDPVAKIFDFYYGNIETDSSEQQPLLQTAGGKLIRRDPNYAKLERKANRIMKELWGDTTNVYPLGLEIVGRIGDPTDASSTLLPVIVSSYVVSVSESPIDDDVFKVPDGFSIETEEEDSDSTFFFPLVPQGND